MTTLSWQLCKQAFYQVGYGCILQTEDKNTSDIKINYSSDVSNVGTIIYDQNLRNDAIAFQYLKNTGFL